ncbi:flagellar biosynthesis protein FlgD, partial [Pseudomonas sp. MWU12-2534b]
GTSGGLAQVASSFTHTTSDASSSSGSGTSSN